MLRTNARACVIVLAGCSLALSQQTAPPQADKTTTPPAAEERRKSSYKPKDSVRGTIEEAIRALEGYECETVALDFLNPIKRTKIEDVAAYRRQRQCSPDNKGNVEEVLLALKLARRGTPDYKGVTATISLEGIGIRIQKITLMRYLDGKWYFNEL